MHISSLAGAGLLVARSAIASPVALDHSPSPIVSTATEWEGFARGYAHPTLVPTVPIGHNPGKIEHLNPSHNHAIQYTNTDPNQRADQQLYASLNATFIHPAVVVDHSALITGVICNEDGLSLKLVDQGALTFAEENWNASRLILATTTCGADFDDQHACFVVSNLEYDRSNLTVNAKAAEVDLPNCMTDVDLEWGYLVKDSPAGSVATSTTLDKRQDSTSTTSSSASTDSTAAATGGTCGDPPAPTISGFPAAACGADFDQTLDSELGYLNWDNFAGALQDLAPGLGDYDESDYQPDDLDDGISPNVSAGTTKMRMRSLIDRRNSHIEKRFSFSPKAIFQKVVNKVVDVVKAAPAAIGNAVPTAAKAGYNLVDQALSNLFSPSIDASTNFNVAPKTLTDSVFGPAYQLYHTNITRGAATGSVDVYCVNCQVNGYIRVAGAVSFSILSASISQGYLQTNGNFLAEANVGIAAQASYQPDPIKKNIASVGIPILTIPKVIVVGPQFSLDATLAVSIEAIGQLLVGASVGLPNFNARLDLVDSSKTTASGFTPVFNTRFDASGQITLSSSLGLPITIGVGVDLLPLGDKGRRLISVINTPSVSVNAQYSTQGTCANGISYSLGLSDTTDLDFFQLKQVNLASYTGTPVSGCRKLGSTRRAVATLNRGMTRRQDNESAATTDIIDPDSNTDGSDTQYSTKYTAMVDITGSYVLVGLPSGNLGVVANTGSKDTDSAIASALSIPGAAFESWDGIIAADDADRILYYFPDTMNALNVSRLRINTADLVPQGADIIALYPVNDDGSSNTPGVYMASDTEGNLFYTIACNYADGASKIFLARDPVAGADILAQESLRYIVTGGVVQSCAFVPFVADNAGRS